MSDRQFAPFVLPSDVRRHLLTKFEFLRQYETDRIARDGDLHASHARQVAPLIGLVRAIPPHLQPADSAMRAEYLGIVETLNFVVASWGNAHPSGSSAHTLRLRTLYELFDILGAMPDEAPAQDADPLPFIRDDDLRRQLRTDLSAALTSLDSGLFKAATVLAGSVIEALLLDALETLDADERGRAIAQIAQRKKLAARALDEWHLHELIEVAEKARLLTADEATRAALAKDYRNLIHPGRVRRLAQECNRSVAHGALSGMFAVVDARVRHSSE